jgi:hypothetical protein
MMRYFRKFAPFLAIFALVTLVVGYIKSNKSGTSFIDYIKSLIMPMFVFTAGCFALYDLAFNDSPAGLLIAVVWGTVGASTTGTFSFNFVPQFIEFITATEPSLLQINVNGDGMIFNLDGPGATKGLQAMTHIRSYSRATNSFIYQLADGLLNNKNGTVTITTGVSACTVRAWSPNKNGSFYCTFNPAQALASQAYNLTSFAYASFANAAAGDSFQLSYNDGSLDNVTREELNTYLGYFENSGIPKFAVDNISPARISQVTFTPAAAQLFYVMKYQPAYGGVINANPNV